MDTLSGYHVASCSYMVGAKRAVKFGRTIYVSPAMWDLLSHASPEELERLLVSIPLVDMGEAPDLAHLDIITSRWP